MTTPNFDLSELCKTLVPSSDLKKWLEQHRGKLSDFGKKNSHILREKLFKLFERFNVSTDSQFMLYFFSSLIKRKKRLLDGLDKLSDDTKSLAWFEGLREFVDNVIVDFPEDEDETHFALIHLPSTNPPLILVCLSLAVKKEDFTFEFFLSQQVSAQIHLSSDVQAMQKARMVDFWTNTIKKTTHMSNRVQFEKRVATGSAFDEEIYKNQENDQYLLLNKNFKSIAPSNPNLGYSEMEIKNWISSITAKTEKAKKTQAPTVTDQDDDE